MKNRLDLTGERFGRLVAIEFSHRHVSPRGSSASMWRCRCDCGKEGRYRLGALRSGHVKSCGCSTKETSGSRFRTHGLSKLPEYDVWRAMKRRCNLPSNKDYANYGGRGIKVCDRWNNDFACFLADVGPRPTHKHTIDRINPDGNYEPNNVRWIPMAEQSKNRRCVKRVYFQGQELTAAEIAARVGLQPKQVFHKVFRRGMDPNTLWGSA